MRRYSRYKICKTNFHFFFLSSRLLNFNRPKWNLVKEKIKNFRKINTNKYKHKLKYSRYTLRCFFNIPCVFKPTKLIQEVNKKIVIPSQNYSLKPVNCFFYKNPILSFEYSFIN